MGDWTPCRGLEPAARLRPCPGSLCVVPSIHGEGNTVEAPLAGGGPRSGHRNPTLARASRTARRLCRAQPDVPLRGHPPARRRGAEAEAVVNWDDFWGRLHELATSARLLDRSRQLPAD